MAEFLAIIAAISNVLKEVSVIVEDLKVICDAIVTLGKALDLIPEDEDVGDLGEKALQAEEAGIVPENFETYEQYHKEISEFKINPDERHSEKEQLTKGSEVASSLIAEKYPDLNIAEMLEYMSGNPEGFFSKKNMEAIGKLVKTGGAAIGNIINVLSGSEKSFSAVENAYGAMAEVLQTADPSLSAEEAKEKALEY